ncbi:MAG TPA: T9SS type A sorting domain-containing protein, partial [Niastella sp.]
IVERSANGKTFSTLGTVAAVNETGNRNYSYVDGSPLDGTNFYRLRIEETTGSMRHSTIVSLRSRNITGQRVSVYPNPIRNNKLQFEASLSAGEYTLKVINSIGVVVMSTFYKHPGGTVVQALPVPRKMTTGVYHLIISGSKAQVITTFIK